MLPLFYSPRKCLHQCRACLPQGRVELRSGYLHPLMQLRSEFRRIFLEMGFTEMPTNSYVESAFWNFDALFQPQQHPARDAQDTFYVADPATCLEVPEDYLERVCWISLVAFFSLHSVGKTLLFR